MSDYIKREDAIDACLEETSTKWSTKEEAEEGRIIANVIKSLPSADVMPVRHGQWIYGESEEGHDGYRCSECGKFIPWEYDKYDIDFIKEVHYCPNCGARLDGGVDDNYTIELELGDHTETINGKYSEGIDWSKEKNDADE